MKLSVKTKAMRRLHPRSPMPVRPGLSLSQYAWQAGPLAAKHTAYIITSVPAPAAAACPEANGTTNGHCLG
jgi:hypothetical protein